MRFRSFGNMLQNFSLFWFLSQTNKFLWSRKVKNLEPDIEFKLISCKFTFIKIPTAAEQVQRRLQNKSNGPISKLIFAICNCSD